MLYFVCYFFSCLQTGPENPRKSEFRKKYLCCGKVWVTNEKEEKALLSGIVEDKSDLKKIQTVPLFFFKANMYLDSDGGTHRAR